MPNLQVVKTRVPTIDDVAEIAGVSTSTVSRALGDSPHVREETRERVRAAAETLNYVPNDAARMLAARRFLAKEAV